MHVQYSTVRHGKKTFTGVNHRDLIDAVFSHDDWAIDMQVKRRKATWDKWLECGVSSKERFFALKGEQFECFDFLYFSSGTTTTRTATTIPYQACR